MSESDKVLYAEFKRMLFDRRAVSQNVPLASLPIPSEVKMSSSQLKRRSVTFKNIREPFFDALNKTNAFLMGRSQLQKRSYLSDGTFQKDANGKEVSTPVPVPQGSLAIVSPINIKLPNVVNGHRHTPSQGFFYVDFKETPNGRLYIYIIPRDYIYELNLCSLVISTNRKRVFYKGTRVALQNGAFVYIYVTPYRYTTQADTLILNVKNSVDFDVEVRSLIAFWQSKGVIFNLALCALEDHIQGHSNLAMTMLDPTVVFDDFSPVGRHLLTQDNSVDDDDLL